MAPTQDKLFRQLVLFFYPFRLPAQAVFACSGIKFPVQIIAGIPVQSDSNRVAMLAEPQQLPLFAVQQDQQENPHVTV